MVINREKEFVGTDFECILGNSTKAHGWLTKGDNKIMLCVLALTERDRYANLSQNQFVFMHFLFNFPVSSSR